MSEHLLSEGYQALRAHAAWLDLSSHGKIFATGSDRARLLHAISTNHIQQLTPGSGCYAFFLSAQGRIQADAFILCLEDRFLLDTEPEAREKLYRHLDKYIIADDVTLEDVSDSLAAIGLEGPKAAAILSAAGAPAPETDYSHEPWGAAFVARISSTGAPGLRIFLPAGRKTEMIGKLESAGAVAASAEDARVVRLEHGKPRYGEDIFDTTLPQETQQMHAMHFNKGCYLGQEIVERVRSRGHVNRLLQPVQFNSDQTPPGELTSSAYSPALGRMVGLAYVRVQR